MMRILMPDMNLSISWSISQFDGSVVGSRFQSRIVRQIYRHTQTSGTVSAWLGRTFVLFDELRLIWIVFESRLKTGVVSRDSVCVVKLCVWLQLALSASYCRVTAAEMKRWLLAEKLPSVHRRCFSRRRDERRCKQPSRPIDPCSRLTWLVIWILSLWGGLLVRFDGRDRHWAGRFELTVVTWRSGHLLSWLGCDDVGRVWWFKAGLFLSSQRQAMFTYEMTWCYFWRRQLLCFV